MTTESATSSSSNNYSSSAQEQFSNVADSMEGYTNQSIEINEGSFNDESSIQETIEQVTEKSSINWKYVFISIVLLAVAFFYFKKLKKEKEKLKVENN